MPRLLALEWDAREARVAVARTRGRDLVIEHAFAVDLVPRDMGAAAEVNVGEQIAAALAARSVGRCETLVAVGRASIELRRLSIPPSPPEELPDMVRFQALRTFTGIGDDWPLDFVPLESTEADSLSVLAATISPEIVEQIRQTCRAAELTPRRLILRPFAAASLLRRQKDTAGGACRLMVDLLAEEADLTVVVDQQVALVRTVRVPPETSGAAPRALVSEIRRTIGAAHNQLRDRRIEDLVLFGDGQEQAALKALLEQELGLEVETFDPFAGVTLSAESQAAKPDHPGRFAPLLGMLVDEASGAEHAIDFLHPRRRPEPPNRRRRYVLIGSAVAACALAIALLIWSQLTQLDSEIAILRKRSNDLKDKVAEAERKLAAARTVEGFLDNDIPWLDELYRLSRDLPSSEEVILTQLTLINRSPAGGQIVLDGYTREHDHIRAVEESLSSDGRMVYGDGGQFDPRREAYNWRIKERVLIEPASAGSGDGEANPPADGTPAAKTPETPSQRTQP